MSSGRHSYIAFYPSDWIAGTARMSPMHELIYFRVCLYNWDKAEPCPATDLPLMFSTVPDWRVLLLDLVQAGKLVESPDGSLANTRAIAAALDARARYERACHRIDGRLAIDSTEWKEIRAAVFERDGYTCRYCGIRGGPLECDHVHPVVLGGPTTMENLVTACRPCNRSKGAKTMKEWVQ